MQIHRITEIVFALLSGEKLTAKELAARLEVSPRTVYRDLEVLSAAGIPVYTDKGNGGGVAIEESYRLKSAALSEEEKRSLITIVSAHNARLHDRSTAVLLDKLNALFKTPDNPIEVDFSDWNGDDSLQRTFDELQKCVLEKRLALMEYRNAAGDFSKREVEPLKLLFKHRHWYLYAYCRSRNETRIFKLSRIQNVQSTSERFDRVCDKQTLLNELDFKGNVVDVVFKMKSVLKGLIYEYCPEKNLEPDENGDFLMNWQMPNNDWLIKWATAFGENIEILQPLWLREQVRVIHERAAKI